MFLRLCLNLNNLEDLFDLDYKMDCIIFIVMMKFGIIFEFDDFDIFFFVLNWCCIIIVVNQLFFKVINNGGDKMLCFEFDEDVFYF